MFSCTVGAGKGVPWEVLLRVGSGVAAEARADIARTAGFRTSAGIACNKLMAKLVSGLHKPDDQTVMPPPAAAAFVAPLPVRSLPGMPTLHHNTPSSCRSNAVCWCTLISATCRRPYTRRARLKARVIQGLGSHLAFMILRARSQEWFRSMMLAMLRRCRAQSQHCTGSLRRRTEAHSCICAMAQ